MYGETNNHIVWEVQDHFDTLIGMIFIQLIYSIDPVLLFLVKGKGPNYHWF